MYNLASNIIISNIGVVERDASLSKMVYMRAVINHGVHRSCRLSAAIRHFYLHRSLICIMIVLMAGEFGISRTRTRDVHCLDICWLLLQFRGFFFFFFFSVESTMPIKIKTAGCCRSIGSMPVARRRISKWIRREDSTAHLAGRR